MIRELVVFLVCASFALGVLVGYVLIPDIIEIVRLKRLTARARKLERESLEAVAAMKKEGE